MGVDITATINHKMTIKELIGLPGLIDSWRDVAAKKPGMHSPGEWRGDTPLSPDELECILNWENGTQHSERIFDNCVEAYFGNVDVWRNALTICHIPEHKYANLGNADTAELILTVNRMIARHLKASHIFYVVDSTFPTSKMIEYPQAGLTVEEMIVRGEEEFGKPPSPITEGMKYTYFVDDFSDDLSQLTDWSFNESRYWTYNYSLGKYELNRPGKK